MGRFYATHYPPGESTHGHWVWAKNMAEAEEICKKLQLQPPATACGTSVSSITEMRASKLIQLPGGICRGDVGHSIAFLSFLAVRAGADPLKILHDSGAIHTRAHALHIAMAKNWNEAYWLTKTIQAILNLEALVPGLPPDHVTLRILEGEVPGSYHKAVAKKEINKFRKETS